MPKFVKHAAAFGKIAAADSRSTAGNKQAAFFSFQPKKTYRYTLLITAFFWFNR